MSTLKLKHDYAGSQMEFMFDEDDEPTFEALGELSPAVTDNINHPSHYKVGAIETIDYIEAKALGYLLGNVVKYVSRAGHKQGSSYIEDLQKAHWYLERAIQAADLATARNNRK